MKLLSSLRKELILASRSFYFYIEIGMSLIVLAVLLFAIPTESSAMQTEYIFIDLPVQGVEYFEDEILKDDLDGQIEMSEIEAGGVLYGAKLLVTDEQEIYLVNSEEAVRALSEEHMNIGAVIGQKEGELHYKYYLQGYESDKLKNLVSVLHNVNTQGMTDSFNAQEVREISSDYVPLNDRQNAIPPLMVFTGSLMGMFIMAAYIFLDKEEGVIKAYAVTASSVTKYLLSKVFVLLVTTVVSGLIIVAPVMLLEVNYGLLILLLLTTGFFASTIGLLLGTFFDNMMKSFGMVFILIMVLMLPSIAYFIPSWDPVWIRVIPSYPMLAGFKEIFLKNGDVVYVLLVSAGFLAAGILLFFITRIRFKQTLSV